MVKIMLDPGHDEFTPGKGVAGLREFHFNRGVVEKMIPLLNGYEGVEVVVSHDMYDGIDQSLKQRTDLANRSGVHCFVSVHANAASVSSADGIETFVHPRAPRGTVNLGATVHGFLIRETGLDNRGLKKADFHVLRETRMEAILVECGFMTNPGDSAKLKDEGYRQTCAQAIVNGLVEHYKLQKKAVAPSSSPVPSSQPVNTTRRVQIVNVNTAAIIMDNPDRINGANIGTIAKGAVVDMIVPVAGYNNGNTGYYKIVYNSKTGYINAKYGQEV